MPGLSLVLGSEWLVLQQSSHLLLKCSWWRMRLYSGAFFYLFGFGVFFLEFLKSTSGMNRRADLECSVVFIVKRELLLISEHP